ncbi:2-polyprenyl-6-methoxyphenol hydroxylase [Mucilaginibacter lappiensis]|uniref:Flavin-dependent monooxygenase n=1 Tax=Mucilaginibacter lappiensis TaxID=354630 RepID=A0ABR6PC08_9SPHI|nr:NAD(P)/FAD-dependent oxidoreductase [Mucilaginibacter lappiensis]MBB6107288.1 2-polyprenyl-6-methoxyphenol hydroxylase-like FAD-dependent oxidoreductase [Mucilaginibacter lappiensis]SIQ13538.1 2-polyprenyl-6-methoxyphenol hydroxylase [Mucilaginibacter lappiensis]
MNNIKNKKIAIVGGGPGGLTLARLLQMNGADVKVYERDINKDARAKGATLDLHQDSGLKALQEAGLMDAFNANFRPGADRVRIIDKDANIVLDEHDTPKREMDRPEIDRGPLQNILLDSLQPGTVVWDSHFLSMVSQGNSWKLEFKNGLSVIADMVIAADGANSKLRPYITPIKPFYSGVTAIEGAVHHSETASPKMHQLLKGGKIFGMGNEKTLIVSSKGDGSLVFYAGLKTDENWVKDSGIDFTDKAQVLAWFKTAYADWDSVWQELFENASYAFVARPQYCMPFDQTWEALPNLTILGDAAHLMPPYAGEGVNMAMQDALELSQYLLSEDFADTQSTIAAYEAQMRVRASEIAMITMESTAALHSPQAIDFLLSIIG